MKPLGKKQSHRGPRLDGVFERVDVAHRGRDLKRRADWLARGVALLHPHSRQRGRRRDNKLDCPARVERVQITVLQEVCSQNVDVVKVMRRFRERHPLVRPYFNVVSCIEAECFDGSVGEE